MASSAHRSSKRKAEDEMAKLGIEKAEQNCEDTETDSTIPKLSEIVYLQIGSTQHIRNNRYAYVSNLQNTKFAVAGVHTLEEVFFFFRLLEQCYSGGAAPNFGSFAFKWNQQANGNKIFYKTAEIVEKYYNIYFIVPIPVIAPEVPTPLSASVVPPQPVAPKIQASPCVPLSGVVKISTKRSCKGYGSNLSDGKNNRTLCTQAICFECQKKDCTGLFDSKKCNTL